MFISTYGQFHGVKNYFVLAAPKGMEERVGYYGENQGIQHPLRPVERFFEAYGDVPGWFIEGVKAAVLAPTAVNQQKFKFILHPSAVVEARAQFSLIGYTAIDLGIAKYHFEIGAGKENFTWKA